MSSERETPCVTPWIMFATSVRESPCSCLARRESLGRSTRICPWSRTTMISRSSLWLTLPLGPSTETRPAWTFTLTFSGTLMGSLPMRDMEWLLPDGGEELAAQVLLARLAIDHDPLGGGEHGDAEPVHHLGDVLVADVPAKARRRLPLDLADRGPFLGVVLEDDRHDALLAVLAARH